jgi:hypothetical protein
MGFVVDEEALEHVFLLAPQFYPTIPKTFHIHLSSRANRNTKRISLIFKTSVTFCVYISI